MTPNAAKYSPLASDRVRVAESCVFVVVDRARHRVYLEITATVVLMERSGVQPEERSRAESRGWLGLSAGPLSGAFVHRLGGFTGKKCDGKVKVEQVNPGLLMRHLLQFHHVCMIKTSGILFLLSELMCKQNR